MGEGIDSGLQHVRVTVENHVGWLEFDRAPVNAFEWTMVRQTRDAIDDLGMNPDVRVIVLASALDKYFSAGADLETFRGIDEAGMNEWCSLVHDIVRRLRSSPKPVLAAIHGIAVGGGLEMTLHCDLRFASTTARLGQPEISINFIPPVGATQALVRLVGRPNTLKYLYGGDLLDAQQALQLGLIDELVEPDILRETVQTYAETLSSKPPEALAAIRRAINHGGGLTFDEGLEVERTLAVALAGTDNFKEGVQAFLDKRAPEWRR